MSPRQESLAKLLQRISPDKSTVLNLRTHRNETKPVPVSSLESVIPRVARDILWRGGEAKGFVALCERHIKPSHDSMDVIIPSGDQLERSLQQKIYQVKGGRLNKDAHGGRGDSIGSVSNTNLVINSIQQQLDKFKLVCQISWRTMEGHPPFTEPNPC